MADNVEITDSHKGRQNHKSCRKINGNVKALYRKNAKRKMEKKDHGGDDIYGKKKLWKK